MAQRRKRKARGNRSGPSLTEEQRAASGQRRINYRLDAETYAMLQQIADDMDEPLTVVLTTLIRMEHQHSFARRPGGGEK